MKPKERSRAGSRPVSSLCGLTFTIWLVATGQASAAERRAFVSSAMGSGDLSSWGSVTDSLDGLAGADAACQNLAEAAGLALAGEPVFRAWLSDSLNDAYCRLQGAAGKKLTATPCGGLPTPGAGPWVKVDGTAFAPDLDSLVGGAGLTTPLDRDEDGLLVAGARFWSATYPPGTGAGPGHYCGDWSDATGLNFVELGSTDSTFFGWTARDLRQCAHDEGRLACFEVGTGDPLPEEPWEPAALVFLTSASGDGDLGEWAEETEGKTGVAAGDSICRALARSARLPGADSYLAYLSDSGVVDARDRFAIDGPWRRPDHHLVAADVAQLTSSRLDAQITLTEQGVHADRQPWTGTGDDGLATDATCSDWLSASTGDGTTGLSQRASSEWSDNLDSSCAKLSGTAIYCFGDEIVLFWNDFEADSLAPSWSGSEGLAD